MNRAPTCEGYAFEGTWGHAGMGMKSRSPAANARQTRAARGAAPTSRQADATLPQESFLSSPVLSPSWTSRMSMRLSMLTQRLLIGVSFW